MTGNVTVRSGIQIFQVAEIPGRTATENVVEREKKADEIQKVNNGQQNQNARTNSNSSRILRTNFCQQKLGHFLAEQSTEQNQPERIHDGHGVGADLKDQTSKIGEEESQIPSVNFLVVCENRVENVENHGRRKQDGEDGQMDFFPAHYRFNEVVRWHRSTGSTTTVLRQYGNPTSRTEQKNGAEQRQNIHYNIADDEDSRNAWNVHTKSKIPSEQH